MNRQQYLLDQKKKFGRRVLGVFPALYPKEILWAHNILPVEIWDPPLAPERAKAHLQPYICSVVQAGVELILSGRAGLLDGLLFPHTCDSIQNAASMIHDYLRPGPPCFFFQHPRAPYGESSRKYYLAQLRRLDEELSQAFGPNPNGELERSVELGRRISGLLREIYELRLAGRLGLSNVEFYRAIRSGEFLWPDDYGQVLETALSGTEQGLGTGRQRIVLSGILPAPRGLLELLDNLGGEIVADDLLSCWRRVPSSPKFQINDPLPSLSQDYFNLPPCPTKDSPLAARLDHLLDLVERGGAGGVVFNVVKFCEPELFDLPNLRAGLKEAGVPVLTVETEVNEPLSGGLTTRVEAFLEMIG